MSKCIGILGFILGHKYESIFDEDKEYYSIEERQKLLEKIDEYNQWHVVGSLDASIIGKPKRITKIYKGHVCSRCGDKKEDKLLTL